MIPNDLSAVWITSPDSLPSTVGMFCFCKRFSVEAIPAEYFVHITADSRYRLSVNGQMLANGPCRTTTDKKYIDTVDLSSALTVGENTVEVWVAHYADNLLDAMEYKGGPTSVVSTPYMALYIMDPLGRLSTDGSWLVRPEARYTFLWMDRPRSELCFTERLDYTAQPMPFVPAIPIAPLAMCNEYGAVSYFSELLPRPIPMPYMEFGCFSTVVYSDDPALWQDVCRGRVAVPPHMSTFVELDAATYQTAFLHLCLKGKAKMRLISSECYYQKGENGYFKGDRTRIGDGSALIGLTDEIISASQENEYISYNYRAFRFVRIEIKTMEEPFELSVGFIRTGYPLEVTGRFHSAHETDNSLWDASLRTLRSCMYETYMDCPFYEQKQYLMDGYLQLVYTLFVSEDLRLAEKMVDDFNHSMTAEGKMPSCTPSRFRQYIWGFPIFWIFMIREIYCKSGNMEFVRKYYDGILRLLHHLCDAVDETSGMVVVREGWSFVDWIPAWNETRGAPVENGTPNTIYTMMLAAALSVAGELAETIGRPDTSILIRKSLALRRAADRLAYDPGNGMYQDAPSVEQFSMHTQIWAVLSETARGKRARSVLRTAARTVPDVSYCYNYFLFKAFRKAGIYSESAFLWESLHKELKKNLTTLPEDAMDQRSDCHAWSAVALSEFPYLYFGYCERNGTVSLCPNTDLSSEASVVLPVAGGLEISYQQTCGKLTVQVNGKQPKNWQITLRDGRIFHVYNKAAFALYIKYSQEDETL